MFRFCLIFVIIYITGGIIMEKAFNENIFYEVLSQHGINCSATQREQFALYAKLLVEWNEKMNLTAITQIDEIYEKHFLDSILPSFDIEIKGSLCDVGSGAGFPSIPLKIINPSLSITIIETLGKRVTFLNELCKQLKLEDVTCLHARAEEAVLDLRETFDVATARAVANLPMLCELCIPFVKVGGRFIAMKGDKGYEEYNESKKAIRVLGCELHQAHEVHLSDGSQRINFECLKVRATPKQYPRAFAKIKKSALKGE